VKLIFAPNLSFFVFVPFFLINKPHVEITRTFTCSPYTEYKEKTKNREKTVNKREVCHSSQRISYICIELLMYKREKKRSSTKRREKENRSANKQRNKSNCNLIVKISRKMRWKIRWLI